MSLLGNIIWLICGGLISGIGYIVGGVALCLTIIGIPLGYQSIKIGIATFAPFGTVLVEHEDAHSPLYLVLDVVWIFTFGWAIALHHLIWAVLLGITVIGIPFALQHLKLIPLALLPFGRDLVRGPLYPQDYWAEPHYERPVQVR
jgi:uncharacterized membrane protein YccF (DUF307 family)